MALLFTFLFEVFAVARTVMETEKQLISNNIWQSRVMVNGGERHVFTFAERDV